MSTIKDAAWAADVDDEDYRPDALSRTRSSSGSDDGDSPPSKRPQVSLPELPTSAPARIDVDELYSSFQECGTTSRAPNNLRNKVKIQKHYTFAGEDHVYVLLSLSLSMVRKETDHIDREEVEVWENSPEALEYAAQQLQQTAPLQGTGGTERTGGSPLSRRVDAPIDRGTDHFGQGYERRQAEMDATSAKQGPKRSRASLASMAATLGSRGTKAVKLSTLEKSKLDWDKCAPMTHVVGALGHEQLFRYVTRNDIADELSRGRQDGWTERQAFLDRTGERQDSGMARLQQQHHRTK